MNISTKNMWRHVRHHHRCCHSGEYFAFRYVLIYGTQKTDLINEYGWMHHEWFVNLEFWKWIYYLNSIIVSFDPIYLMWWRKNLYFFLKKNLNQLQSLSSAFIMHGFSILCWPSVMSSNFRRQVAKCISFSRSIFSPLKEFRYSFFVFFLLISLFVTFYSFDHNM